MRAAVYYAPDDLRMEDMETPEKPDQKANPDRTSGFPSDTAEDYEQRFHESWSMDE